MFLIVVGQQWSSVVLMYKSYIFDYENYIGRLVGIGVFMQFADDENIKSYPLKQDAVL